MGDSTKRDTGAFWIIGGDCFSPMGALAKGCLKVLAKTLKMCTLFKYSTDKGVAHEARKAFPVFSRQY